MQKRRKKQARRGRDIFDTEKRSEIMSRIKSKNTTPEVEVFEYLSQNGVKFRRNYGRVVGRPDIAIPTMKRAVFIDSDFWHGWQFPRWQNRMSKFWRQKIGSNRARDRYVSKKLRREGWRVLRVWTHRFKKQTKQVLLNDIYVFLTSTDKSRYRH